MGKNRKRRKKKKKNKNSNDYNSITGFAKDKSTPYFVINFINIVHRNMNHFELSNSQIGLLNQGSISNVESIDVSIDVLLDSGRKKVADAFKELTDAILASNEFASESDRQELLDQIEELSGQAGRNASERKLGIVRATFNAIAITAGALGGIASVWATWGPVIQEYFGI